MKVPHLRRIRNACFTLTLAAAHFILIEKPRKCDDFVKTSIYMKISKRREENAIATTWTTQVISPHNPLLTLINR